MGLCIWHELKLFYEMTTTTTVPASGRWVSRAPLAAYLGFLLGSKKTHTRTREPFIMVESFPHLGVVVVRTIHTFFVVVDVVVVAHATHLFPPISGPIMCVGMRRRRRLFFCFFFLFVMPLATTWNRIWNCCHPPDTWTAVKKRRKIEMFVSCCWCDRRAVPRGQI